VNARSAYSDPIAFGSSRFYLTVLGAHQCCDSLPWTENEEGCGVGRLYINRVQGCDDEVMVVYRYVKLVEAGTVDEAELCC